MDRRRFLVAMAACVPAALAARNPPPLRPVRVKVDGLAMFALVSDANARTPPIVLVHGSGLSGRYMLPTAEALIEHFPVYVPDLPGYGESDDAGEVLDVPGLADWLAAWMEAIGLERAALLGNSFGCQVIADLAVRHPQRVSHVLLQGPTTPPEERSVFWQFIRWRQNQRFNPKWLGDVTMHAYRQAGLWRLLRGFHFQITDRIEDKMPHIQAPLAVIRGGHDPITRHHFAERLARLAPRGELVVIPSVAHTLVSVAPEPLARAAREFIERH